jgi:hypothetical protein
MNDTSILTTGIVIAIALLLLERFVFRRGSIKLIDYSLANQPAIEDESIAIIANYSTNSKTLPFSKLRGRLVDKAAPTTVIELKARSLALRPQEASEGREGEDHRLSYCQEFLYFDIKPFLSSGDEVWELHLDVATIGCRVNPFYKIFPVQVQMRGDIKIQQPNKVI